VRGSLAFAVPPIVELILHAEQISRTGDGIPWVEGVANGQVAIRRGKGPVKE